MPFLPTLLQGVYLLETTTFKDSRGSFSRLYCEEELKSIGLTSSIAQVNYSLSHSPGTIRGLHFQRPPMAEVKIVRCIHGAVFDVVVDLRRDSPTLFQWFGHILSPVNKLAMYVPRGVAHGFQVIESESELLYLHTALYSPAHEGGIRYDDPRVGIRWPIPPTEISERDKNHPLLITDFHGLDIGVFPSPRPG